MSQDQNIATPADRILLRENIAANGDPNSLRNLNTDLLPNGALCYVSSVGTLYTLDKTAVSGGVTPESGPGRWRVLSIAEGESGVVFLDSNGFNTFLTDGNWGQSQTGNFIIDAVSDPAWALTAAGGILTYTGVTRKFLVNLSGSVRVTDASAARDVFIGISKNDDTTGAPTAGTSGQVEGVIASGSANASLPMSTARIVQLASGDTLRPKMAGPVAASEISAMLLMAVTPA